MRGDIEVAIGEARKVSGGVEGAIGLPEKRTRKRVVQFEGVLD